MASIAAGCAAPHTAPRDMTSAEHDRAADAHARTAKAEAERVEPEDRQAPKCRLLDLRGAECREYAHEQATEHERAAVTERKRAAEHRAAAQRLRDEEARACAGVDPKERDAGPLAGGPAFTAQALIDYDAEATIFGVSIAFASRDMGADRLQTLAECHRAAIANRGAAAHACALDDPDLSLMVVATPHGTVLQLRSKDPLVARRAWERAREDAKASRTPLAPPPLRARRLPGS